jgi:hypothetical protein
MLYLPSLLTSTWANWSFLLPSLKHASVAVIILVLSMRQENSGSSSVFYLHMFEEDVKSNALHSGNNRGEVRNQAKCIYYMYVHILHG